MRTQHTLAAQDTHTALQAFTAAALCLPGLVAPALAADQETSFTYGHYQEGHRQLYGANSHFNPIEVESLLGATSLKLGDRATLRINYEQDTWGGATPIASMPLAFGGNGHYTGTQSLVSGATPILVNTEALFDQQLNPVERIGDGNGNETYKTNRQIVDTLSLASPETRQQGDFKLGYEGDAQVLELGGGVSVEDDYVSGFGNANGRWDFNQKLTTLSAGLSYTHSNTYARNDHDASGYITRDHTYDAYTLNPDPNLGGAIIGTGTRQDWSTSLGLSQILNKQAVLEASLAYTRSTGFMENPYKAVAVAFIDPNSQDQCPEADLGLLCANIQALLEQRPDERNQWTGNLRYVQHIAATDAAVHLGYRIFSDDWGIMSHTFEADWAQPLGHGWTLTPRIRYYSQASADFYTPYLKSFQGAESNALDSQGREILIDGNNPDNGQTYFYDEDTDTYTDRKGNDVTEAVNNGDIAPYNKTVPFARDKLPKHYSSDYRLAAYGALSGGVTLSKQFAKGVALDVGVEYYSHQNALKIGGGNDNSFNDFDAWSATATLKVDLSAVSLASAMGGGHEHHHHHHGAHAPAGVMFDHMLPKAGDMMVGYRFMYGSQGGDLLHGTRAVSNAETVAGGCGPNPCFVSPATMAMEMHMIDLMYAPTDWLTLMLMPQFMHMDMTMDRLRGPEYDSLANDNKGNPDSNGQPTPIGDHIPHHIQNGHETGGIGDLGMYALVKLFDDGIHHAHGAVGLSAPTGDVNIELRRNHQVDGGLIHYGMQLGSGTWDFKPSLTYTGSSGDYAWGAQASGTLRMEARNPSGYALGDQFQATAWGGYQLLPWLTASVRGVYTLQGRVKHQFSGLIEQFGPMDYPNNYGGRYWDIGFGLSAQVLTGSLSGNSLSVEWLQPVEDAVNGYQLERNGALTATWGLAF